MLSFKLFIVSVVRRIMQSFILFKFLKLQHKGELICTFAGFQRILNSLEVHYKKVNELQGIFLKLLLKTVSL